jgi:hypothetical protein
VRDFNVSSVLLLLSRPVSAHFYIVGESEVDISRHSELLGRYDCKAQRHRAINLYDLLLLTQAKALGSSPAMLRSTHGRAKSGAHRRSSAGSPMRHKVIQLSS